MKDAILIDYRFCTGCHTCEVACQKHLGLAAEQFGIKLTQIGPDQIDERTWQYEFVPVPTDRCDRCAERTSKGKMPACVQNCQAHCMEVGPAEKLVGSMTESGKYALYV